jgi:hypothetical protein
MDPLLNAVARYHARTPIHLHGMLSLLLKLSPLLWGALIAVLQRGERTTWCCYPDVLGSF